MKTEEEIIDDVKRYLEGSVLANEISGIITDLDRPKNSKNEDVIVKLLSCDFGQIQQAYLNVNIYVPDIEKDGQMVKNKPRLRKLERLSADILERHHGGYFYFSTESQHVEDVDNINCHMINNRVLYKFNN